MKMTLLTSVVVLLASARLVGGQEKPTPTARIIAIRPLSASLVGGQEETFVLAQIALRVYRFQAESDKAEPLLENLLPMWVAGVNAVGKVGVLDEERARWLRRDLERHGKVDVLAHPVLTMASGRPAVFQMGTELPIVVAQGHERVAIEYRRVGLSIIVVPHMLGNGLYRLAMSAEIAETDTSKNVKVGDHTFRKQWVDVATELEPGQTMVTAMLKRDAENSDAVHNQLCTLFVATPSFVKFPAEDSMSNSTLASPPTAREAEAKPNSPRTLTR